MLITHTIPYEYLLSEYITKLNVIHMFCLVATYIFMKIIIFTHIRYMMYVHVNAFKIWENLQEMYILIII